MSVPNVIRKGLGSPSGTPSNVVTKGLLAGGGPSPGTSSNPVISRVTRARNRNRG